MAEERFHLTIAAACSVVDCHLPPCHLIQHRLKGNQLTWIRLTQGACRDTGGNRAQYIALFLLYENAC